MKNFNVRVYGICVNEKREILLVNEEYQGVKFTKFPGGGLEMGEGPIECLKREFKEELDWEIEDLGHFYTTEFYVPSVFDDSQVISIYFEIKGFGTVLPNESFFWRALSDLEVEDVTFPIDQEVVRRIGSYFK
ncbi:MAG: NUDIX hydrolase [Bacteroidota bacterium]